MFLTTYGGAERIKEKGTTLKTLAIFLHMEILRNVYVSLLISKPLK